MFGLHRRSVNIARAGWLDGMSEIHCHLLPGVDDGSESVDETRQLLVQYRELGIRRIVLTPHIMENYPKNTSHTLGKAFERLKDDLFPSGDFSDIELSLGAEYMIDDSFPVRVAEPPLRIGRSDYMLVETSFWGPSLGLVKNLQAINAAGLRPMLAHPERFLYFKRQDYLDLKARGCAFQLNLFSLSGAYSAEVAKRAGELLQAGLYDYIGLDTHHSGVFRHMASTSSISVRYERLVCNLIKNNNKLFG